MNKSSVIRMAGERLRNQSKEHYSIGGLMRKEATSDDRFVVASRYDEEGTR